MNTTDKSCYCFFNKKHNKFAPVGGKYEEGDKDGIATLIRELNEEIEIGSISKIREIGVHTLLDSSSNIRYSVETFIVYTDKVLSPKEDFLELVKAEDIPKQKLTKIHSYTSLLSILDSIKGGCKWRCDAAVL